MTYFITQNHLFWPNLVSAWWAATTQRECAFFQIDLPGAEAPGLSITTHFMDIPIIFMFLNEEIGSTDFSSFQWHHSCK